jgi:hypothetical protein
LDGIGALLIAIRLSVVERRRRTDWQREPTHGRRFLTAREVDTLAKRLGKEPILESRDLGGATVLAIAPIRRGAFGRQVFFAGATVHGLSACVYCLDHRRLDQRLGKEPFLRSCDLLGGGKGLRSSLRLEGRLLQLRGGSQIDCRVLARGAVDLVARCVA